MTNSSPWKIPTIKWRFLAGKIIYKWAIYTMAMLNNQRYIFEYSIRVQGEVTPVNHVPVEGGLQDDDGTTMRT